MQIFHTNILYKYPPPLIFYANIESIFYQRALDFNRSFQKYLCLEQF